MGSDMAAQIQARIAEDGGAGLVGEGVAPGSEGVTPGSTPAPPAAEPSTPDSSAGATTPETVPYARFKEVNDRLAGLRGYEDLGKLGYDPDSLGRLAAFEAAWMQDPKGTWASLADDLDLPQELKDALIEHVGGSGPAEGEQPTGETPAPAPLPPEVQQRLDYVDQLRAREEQADRDKRLDQVVNIWDRMDKQDSIETPEHIKLMAIAATAGSGTQFETLEALAEAARQGIIDYRSGVLGAAVQRTGRGAPPPALPGGPPAPSGPLRFGADIRAATRAAKEAIERGELPPITPGA